MKIIVIGDLHGNPIWKKIIEKEKDADLIIFIGDYFDSYTYSTLEQIHNFNEILEFKKANFEKVTLLIGNHDYNYFPETPDKNLMSGFQGGEASINIGHTLHFNKQYLQISFSYKDLLFTHAGISIDWMKLVCKHTPLEMPNFTAFEIATFTNYVFEYKPFMFQFILGGNPQGFDVYQTPIWIRPKSLMKSCKNIKKNLIQIVGHTPQRKIDIKGKATGSRYFFIDTINSNNEYLIIQDNQFISNKI